MNREEKRKLMGALHVLIEYCDKFQNDEVYWNRCHNPENPCECIFWNTCYYDAYYFCGALRDLLENLEKGELL